jgi:hypothetical protein
MPEGDPTCCGPPEWPTIANSQDQVVRTSRDGAQGPRHIIAGQSTFLLCQYISQLIKEHEAKIEQTWGINPDEDQHLLSSSPLWMCQVLFEVCTTLKTDMDWTQPV